MRYNIGVVNKLRIGAQMKKILSNRSLIILGLAESVSGIGNWITFMAVLAMLVFRGGGGVMESSGIFLSGLLPTLFISPFAGWLVDRVNRKFLLVASEVLSGIVVSLLFITTRIEIIYGILALEAVILSVVTPSRQAVIPDLVSRDDLPKANAFLQQLAGLVKVFSPFIAGLVLSVMDPQKAILFDVISFFLSAGVLMFLPSLPAHGKQVDGSGVNKMANPVAVLRSIPRLQLLFTGVFAAILGIIGFDVLSSVYTRDILQQGERFYGISISLVGIGSLLATGMILIRKRPGDPWKDLTAGFALLGLIPLVLAVVYPIGKLPIAIYLVVAACLVGGIGNGLVHVQVGTIMQLITPPEILGQVGGWLQTVMVASQLIGMVITPLLVPNVIKMDMYFLGMSGIMALVVTYLAVRIFGGTEPKVDEAIMGSK